MNEGYWGHLSAIWSQDHHSGWRIEMMLDNLAIMIGPHQIPGHSANEIHFVPHNTAEVIMPAPTQ